MVARKPLVKKWLTLGRAIMDPALSRADLKVLWELLDHTNDESKIAWPSTRLMARLTGIDHRNLNRSLSKVIGAGYVIQIKRGTWHGESSHYTPTYKGEDEMYNRRLALAGDTHPVVNTDDTPTVITGDDTPVVNADDTLSSPVTQPVIKADARVSSPVTPKPPNEPAYKAGEVVVGESGPHRDGAFGAALATVPARGRNAEAFERFIAAYPLQIDLDKAGGEFDIAVASGQGVEFLIAQAAAYAAWCKAGGVQAKFICRPANWLRTRRWRDRLAADARSPSPKATASGNRNPALDTETDPAALCRLRYEELMRVIAGIHKGKKLYEKLCCVIAEAFRRPGGPGDNFWYYDTEEGAVDDVKRVLSAARRGQWPVSVKGEDEDLALLWVWFGHNDGQLANALITIAVELTKRQWSANTAAA